jgi:hypothetical protein
MYKWGTIITTCLIIDHSSDSRPSPNNIIVFWGIVTYICNRVRRSSRAYLIRFFIYQQEPGIKTIIPLENCCCNGLVGLGSVIHSV